MKKYLLFFFFLLFIPLNIFAFNIKSKYAILYNLNDDEVLYELKPNDKISIASMTKIMTAIVSIEKINDINDTIIMTNEMFYKLVEENASVAGFTLNEEVTYEDLLYGLMLPSGADAAQALAISTYGSIDNFVIKMNDKANELGLKNTKFANPTGLDNPNNYSSVQDVAIILKYALENSEFKKVFSANEYTSSKGNHKFLSTRVKSNVDTSFIDGSKTGFTYDAGLCMASISHYNGVNYLLVTAKAPYDNRANHILDAKTIYNYYFDNYEEKIISNKGDKIVTITVDDEYKIDYYSSKDIKKYLRKDCDLTKTFIGEDTISSSYSLNSKIGEYVIKCNDDILYTQDIVLVVDINTKSNFKQVIIMYSLIGGIILLVIVILILKLRRKK